ncbi:hypothetical protein BDB00DRAFT_841443 [Zychaea mexicana]|uniref:uncharacterized protein n=1 Tax=Zychaea mexicana TaxID=64656 RepID=UPI0022FE04ED|nr:uncharacterized protein BDB00DRAFT_841443 [Zychaea mexicana]KAI9489797.1 hypothetical protein BDB00DRAFT_841443 [Zychaea mexicana]
MRTSRGLRITSLIVVSPVILILISLVVILAIAVQSQVKAWYFAAVSTLPQHQPFFSEPSSSQHHHPFLNARSLSRLASTAFVFSYNHPTTHQLSSSASNSLDSNRFDTPKATVATTRRILPRLKRLLSSSTWIGVLTVFAFITLQKVPLHQPLKSIASCITSPAGNDSDRAVDQTHLSPKPSSAAQHGNSNKRRKKTKRATAAATAAMRQSKLISASAAQPAAQHNQQTQQTTTAAPLATDHMGCTEDATLINPVLRQPTAPPAPIAPSSPPTLESHDDDQLSIESSSDDDESKWINVGGKKTKRSSSIKVEAIAVASAATMNAHAATSASATLMTTNMGTVRGTESMAEEEEEEEVIVRDDDDDTVTTSSATEDEVQSITETPVMEKPRIQSWYSPFSTGLDLDIMPKGSDLLLNKPLAPPMNGDLFFRHHQLEQWRSQQEYPVMMTTTTTSSTMMHHHPSPRRAEQPFTFFDHNSY